MNSVTVLTKKLIHPLRELILFTKKMKQGKYPALITPDEQKRIFERFYCIDHSRSREFGGSGLGLAISIEIIEHHRGTIGVNSENNVHTFWFRLSGDGDLG